MAGLAMAASASALVRHAYVTKLAHASVRPFKIPTNRTESDINVGNSPHGIAITPDGTTAYVANSTDGTVTPVDTATGVAGSPITVGASPYGIAITPDGTTAYVANFDDDNVTPIDIATGVAGSPITVGNGPTGIAIAPDGQTAYVTDSNTTTVTPIDLATGTAGTDIEVGFHPYGIAITPDGATAYVAINSADKVVPIDTATNTAGTAITVGSGPFGVAITPNGKTAYVSRSGYDQVTPIDLATATAGSDIATGSDPRGIAITPNGRTAYVANMFADAVAPIHTATNTVGSAFNVGDGTVGNQYPFWIAITPNQGPTAAFVSTPAASGSPTSFDASASTDPDGTVHKYHWRFGDGTTETTQSPTTTHTYATGGYYRATLRVIDNEHCSDKLVFTGQTVSCNGSAAAKVSHRVAITPSIQIDSGPPLTTSDPDATFTYHSDDPGARFRCRLMPVDPSWGACPSPKAYTGLAPGSYDFRVRALHGANNASGVADYNWTIN
jgi:YVTN family beta-propeller protein